jgi:hypothetical protein
MGSVMICWLFKANLLVEISAPGLSSADASILLHTINACLVRNQSLLRLLKTQGLYRINLGRPAGRNPTSQQRHTDNDEWD